MRFQKPAKHLTFRFFELFSQKDLSETFDRTRLSDNLFDSRCSWSVFNFVENCLQYQTESIQIQYHFFLPKKSCFTRGLLERNFETEVFRI